MSKKITRHLSLYDKTITDRSYDLSKYSHARVGMGHTGGHLKMTDWLKLQTGFACAKDAVFSQFNSNKIKLLCDKLNLKAIELTTPVSNPTEFLLRPDLGKILSSESEASLNGYVHQYPDSSQKDILIVISGGLSPIAIEHQISDFLPEFINKIAKHHWTVAPIVINPRGRVALGDELNSYFKAKLVVMLIGERPGLTTSDSLGIYITYEAKPGCTDEQRNCLSNIHKQGLSYNVAVKKLIYLISQVFSKKMSGVLIKDDFNSKTQDG